jgi:citrate lyase subunit beta/citryl-CoA lyase
MVRPRRSILFMPGSNARNHERARTLAADSLIFDLEDAVTPDGKAAAREQVMSAIKSDGYGRREIIVRINPLDTPWGKADVFAAVAAGPDAILIPKVSCPGDIMHAAKLLRDADAPEHMRIWIMMETALAVLNADSIARTAGDPASRLAVMIMGTNDISRDTRARLTPGRLPMLPYLSLAVAAAHAHGIEIMDGVYNDFSDPAGFRAECEQSRDLGMDGKTLIHPSQIDPCNEIFTPTQEEITWAQKIIGAFAKPENVNAGVIQVEGCMVERMHEEQAQRTVEIARAIAELN